jgi:hypothetical protein
MRWLAALLILIPLAASAQQNQCRTAPVGTSTQYCASEAFVTQSAADNVNGPSSSTAGDIASFSGTSGKTLQDSGIPSAALPTAIGQLPGVTSSTPASSGTVGQNGSVSGSVAMPSGSVIANAVSQLIPSGDWFIWANFAFGGSGSTSVSDATASLTTTSAGVGISPVTAAHKRFSGGQNDFTYTGILGPIRVQFASATTYFCTGSMTYVSLSTLSTMSCTISWSRAR